MTNDSIAEEGVKEKGEKIGGRKRKRRGKHAKGSSLGHWPTKVTSGLDMVIPHSNGDTFAQRDANPGLGGGRGRGRGLDSAAIISKQTK